MKILPHHLAKLKRKEIDAVGYFAVVIGLLFAIPQLIEIIINNSAENVSVITWSGFTISAVFWLIYGIYRKLTPVLIAHTIWIILDLSIVMAIIFYK